MDQKVVLERNPNYWKVDRFGNQLPYFDKLEYLIIKDDEVRLAKFMSGEIDYMAVSAKDFPPVLKGESGQGTPFTVFMAQLHSLRRAQSISPSTTMWVTATSESSLPTSSSAEPWNSCSTETG